MYIEDGIITYHFENDGPYALRHGLQPREKRLTLDEAVKQFPEYAAAIQAVLAQEGKKKRGPKPPRVVLKKIRLPEIRSAPQVPALCDIVLPG